MQTTHGARPTGWKRLLFAIGAALLLPVLLAATCIARMQGRDNVVLVGGTIHSMTLDLRSPRQAICPGDAVQVRLVVNATLEGESQPGVFETYEGGCGTSWNDHLRFADFILESSAGTFDACGWFYPNPNASFFLLRNVGINAWYAADYTLAKAYGDFQPDYTCASKSGWSGAAGTAGSEGTSGVRDQFLFSDGLDGGSGGNGGDGGPGPAITAYATRVRTGDHGDLVAIVATGGGQDGIFLFSPAAGVFRLYATGGAGGAGGNGGPGGHGLKGEPLNGGGPGKTGGTGGNGGNGGPGGSIALFVDSHYPELASAIWLDVAGGAGGAGGNGGAGGPGGQRGSSGEWVNNLYVTTFDGPAGAGGPGGYGGAPGPAGVTSVEVMDVSGMFMRFQNFVPLCTMEGTCVDPSGAGNPRPVDPSLPQVQLRSVLSSQCLTVRGASPGDGAPLEQQACSGAAHQLFRFLEVQSAMYAIQSVATGKVVEIAGRNFEDGTPAQMATRTDADNQLFRVIDQPDHSVSLVAWHSDECLDVQDYSNASGASIIQWLCHNGVNQRFIVEPVR